MSGTYSTTGDVDVDLGKLFGSLVERWRSILAVTLIVTAAAGMLAWSATPHFRAETRILIETRESVFTRPNTGADADGRMLDAEGVASQVEVIGSTDILKKVAARLKLADLPEFDAGASQSPFGRLLVLAGVKSDPMEIPPEERVLKAFREKLTVYRVENSRVIVIEFSSENPGLAAEVPNAIADEYLAVQREAKQQSNADATDWLAPEIEDLTKRVKEAEAKVAAYRSQSDLLIGQNNAVLATQQLSELSSELSRVRASRAAAEANAQSVRRALADGASLDGLPDVLSSGLIQRLRERQAELKASIADLSTTLLDNHPRLRSMRSQLDDLEAQIRTEGQNVLQGLQQEAERARLREQQLVSDLNNQKAASARAGEQEVELRALEREAAAQRELLESYLARYREASSRGDRNYLPADARIFSRAIMPTEPYFPKIAPIALTAFVASLALMSIVVLLQELFSGRAMRPATRARPAPVPEIALPARGILASEPPPLPDDDEARTAELGPHAVAEHLIASGAARAVVVSPEGDEAAASAVMIAREAADAGLRVLLLDLTAAGAASRPMLDGEDLPGITDLLAAEAQFADVIHSDRYSDCHVIPAGTADAARAMRAIDRLPIIMDSLTAVYDLVVVECGPAGSDAMRRLVGRNTQLLVSVIDMQDPGVAAATAQLRAAGHDDLLLVGPEGNARPPKPQDARIAAA